MKDFGVLSETRCSTCTANAVFNLNDGSRSGAGKAFVLATGIPPYSSPRLPCGQVMPASSSTFWRQS